MKCMAIHLGFFYVYIRIYIAFEGLQEKGRGFFSVCNAIVFTVQIDLEHAPLHPVEESPDSASRKFFVGHGGVLKQSSSTLEENDLESLSYECFDPSQVRFVSLHVDIVIMVSSTHI